MKNNSGRQSPFPEAKNILAVQEMPRVLWNRKVRRRAHKSRQWSVS